ncbi:MAG: hypothetical protein RLZZ386_1366, partial [Planctomycetota bacterium]
AVVVGTCTGFNGPNEVRKAFRWKDGVMASLGSLPGGAQDLYWPVAVNDDGSVVVGLSENTDAQGVTTRRAFRWTTVGGMSELPAEITYLHGLSLSGNGAIVVGTRIDGEVGRVACLWSSALGIVDLRTYLVGLGVANVGSLSLHNAAISQDSTSIAVTYQVDGRDAAGIVRGLQFVTSNDDCANALSIELGSVSFNTAGSTTDGNNPTAQFCSPFNGGFFNDIWYSFTPSSTGIFSASTCNQANFDTRIDILDGCGGTLLACNDDACDSLSTYVEFSGVAGQIYLIRLGAFSNTFGTGTLTLALVGSAPSISSVSPSSGTTLGGTAITITGTNLTGASSVTVDGVAATSVNVVSSTSITAVTPAGSAGAKSVAVTTAGGTASLPSAFTFVVPTPTISGVSPSSGTTLGGTAITITGTNLTGATSVTVGGVPATNVIVVSETVVTAVTPSTSVIGTKNVSVSTNAGSAIQIDGFSYVTALSDFSNGGFEAYSISGSYELINGNALFSSAPAVYGWRTTASDNQMEIWTSGFLGVPSHSGNQFAELNANQVSQLFQEISGISAGQNVAYSFAHRGRSGVEQMRFRLIDLGPDNASGGGNDTELENRVLSTGTTGWVVYTGSNTALGNLIQFRFESMGGGSSGNFLDSVQFGDLPSIESVSPTSGTTLGGTAITITGTHFADASTVTVGEVPATSVIVVSETLITAVTPAGTAGVSDVVVTTVGGTATGAFSYINIVAPTGVAASDGLFTNKISVSWNAVPNALGYELFRGATKIADIASGATVAYDDIDESLTPGTSFSYTVKALFTAGTSDESASDAGFVGFTIVAPTGVAASDGLFTNKISVSWNAAANANGYQLFRGATKIADIASGATVSYNDVDGALTPGTSFTYTVKALFTAGVSSPSASDTGFVGFAIVAPTGVAASDGLFTNKISVSWNAAANANGYQLFRGATKIA